jgi:hypothetical protein
MSDTLVVDQKPEHQWFHEAHRADPLLASLAYIATAGSLFVDLSIWRDKPPERTQELLGPVMAYYLSYANRGTLDKLDNDAPVTDWAEIVRPPEGDAPVSVKQDVNGLRGIYVRKALQRNDSVCVHPLDLYLHLLWHGKVQSAAWYRQYSNDRLREGQQVTSWDFSPEDVAVRANPITGSTYNHYQNSFGRSLLGTLSSLHLVGSDEEMRGGTVKIEEYIRDMRRDRESERRARIQSEADRLGISIEIAGNILGLRAVRGAFDRAHRIREAWTNDPSVGRMSSTRDVATGELTYLKVNDVVVIDKEQEVDLTSQPSWGHFARYKPITSEQLERMRGEQASSDQIWACRPKLPSISEDDLAWHNYRLALGL